MHFIILNNESEHKGIVENALFNEAQELLNNQNRRNNDNLEVGKYLLFQKLYNERSEMFKCDTCIKTNKNNSGSKKVKYSYYVTETKRLKCEKIDKTVIELIRQFISSKHITLTPAENDEIAKIDWDLLRTQRQKVLIKYLINKVIYKDNEGTILNLKEYESSKANVNQENFNHQIYISSGQQIINIIADTKTTRIIPAKVNKILLKAVAIGYRYKKLLESGTTIVEISKQENKQDTYIGRMAKLRYLSPRIVEGIFEAIHNESLTIVALEKIADANIDWSKKK